MAYYSSPKARLRRSKSVGIKSVGIGKRKLQATERDMVRIEVLLQPSERAAFKAGTAVLGTSMRHVGRTLIMGWMDTLRDSRVSGSLSIGPHLVETTEDQTPTSTASVSLFSADSKAPR